MISLLLLGLAVLVVLLVLFLRGYQTQDFALTPGNGTPVAPLIKVTGLSTNSHPDKIMLTDVYLEQLSAWGWIESHFQSHIQVVPESELVDPGVSVSQLNAQGYLQMYDAKNAAEYEALSTLGWHISDVANGAVITAVLSSSPASRAGLRVADRVVAVNGASTLSSCALVAATYKQPVGTMLTLDVDQAHISNAGLITYGSLHTVHVRTAAPRAQSASTSGFDCAGVSGNATSQIGVGVEDGFAYSFPGDITINTQDIGGPSAGLAMTLALINDLSSGSLTGQRVVAATGTIATNGAVGDVGGVAEKTVAVENAGATVFIVPDVEVSTAKAASNGHLKILGVNTLAQALRDLRSLGGGAPTPLTKPSSKVVTS